MPNSGRTIRVDPVTGLVKIPGLPPIRIPIETQGDGTVRTAIVVYDETAGKERVPADVTDPD